MALCREGNQEEMRLWHGVDNLQDNDVVVVVVVGIAARGEELVWH